MSNQLTNNPEALRLFFTEDIFLVNEPQMLQNPIEEAQDISIKSVPLTSETALNSADITSSNTALEQKALIGTTSDTITTTTIPEHKEHVATAFKYVGNNERNILILVHDQVNPVSSIAGRQLLGLILKSIKLERNDCALVNYAAYEGASFSELQAFFKPQYVLAFGLSPLKLGLQEAEANRIVNHEGAHIIFSSDLDALNDDPATKKLLWASLKQINLS